MTNEIISAPEVSPAVAMIQQAMQQGMAADQLLTFLAARREWDADEAKKAYFAAISEFQRQAPIIEKGDDAHGKQYARMDRIWRTIRPLFTDLGLSCTWQICTVADGLCHIEGQLAHKQGHSVPLVMDVALPELIRGQNLAQQVGSARTYAQRYAMCAAIGIVTGEDDDGNAAGSAFITREQADELSTLLDKTPDRNDSLQSLLAWADCETLADIPADKFNGASKALRARATKGAA